MALARELVQLLALEPPLLGQDLRRGALGHDVVKGLQPRRERAFAGSRGVRAHGHARHVLDAARDDALVLPGHHAHGGKVRGLLARAAHPVEGGPAHVERKARDEGGVPGNVQPLLAHLIHAAHDDVLDLGRVDLGPLDQGLEGVGEQVIRPDRGELPVALAHGGADRPDDHRIIHDDLLLWWMPAVPPGGA